MSLLVRQFVTVLVAGWFIQQSGAVDTIKADVNIEVLPIKRSSCVQAFGSMLVTCRPSTIRVFDIDRIELIQTIPYFAYDVHVEQDHLLARTDLGILAFRLNSTGFFDYEAQFPESSWASALNSDWLAIGIDEKILVYRFDRKKHGWLPPQELDFQGNHSWEGGSIAIKDGIMIVSGETKYVEVFTLDENEELWFSSQQIDKGPDSNNIFFSVGLGSGWMFMNQNIYAFDTDTNQFVLAQVMEDDLEGFKPLVAIFEGSRLLLADESSIALFEEENEKWIEVFNKNLADQINKRALGSLITMLGKQVYRGGLWAFCAYEDVPDEGSSDEYDEISLKCNRSEVPLIEYTIDVERPNHRESLRLRSSRTII